MKPDTVNVNVYANSVFAFVTLLPN